MKFVFDTDSSLQRNVLERFRYSAGFANTHSLSTVANNDRVLVVNKSHSVELENLYKLLMKEIGEEYNMHWWSIRFDSDENRTKLSSAVIFDIAKKSCFQK